MSETPTTQTMDEKSSLVNAAADHLYETGDVVQHFTAWETEVGPIKRPTPELLDLYEDAEVFSPETYPEIERSQETPAPDYAVQEKTHAQELEESLCYLSDTQLRDYLESHTKAIANTLRHATVHVSNR